MHDRQKGYILCQNVTQIGCYTLQIYVEFVITGNTKEVNNYLNEDVIMTLHKHGGTKRRKSVRKRVPKHLRKKVSKKISKLRHEGKPQSQAIAQGINQTMSESRKR
jgi:hypothetical protein